MSRVQVQSSVTVTQSVELRVDDSDAAGSASVRSNLRECWLARLEVSGKRFDGTCSASRRVEHSSYTVRLEEEHARLLVSS